MLCKGCKVEHEDKSWRFDNGWWCTKWHKPNRMAEFMPDSVKDDRSEYFNSIVQPWRGDTLSKEYVDAHGIDGLDDVTKDDIERSENVWKDLPGWKTRRFSK